MSQVRFTVRRRDDLSGAAEVVPVVDGEELADLIHAFEKRQGWRPGGVSYAGLVPTSFRFGPLRIHFLAAGGAFKVRQKVPLLGCECGEWGCWPLLASVTVDDDAVLWSAFEQPYRPERDYGGFGPFTFDRQEYEGELAALERASRARTSWN